MTLRRTVSTGAMNKVIPAILLFLIQGFNQGNLTFTFTFLQRLSQECQDTLEEPHIAVLGLVMDVKYENSESHFTKLLFHLSRELPVPFKNVFNSRIEKQQWWLKG